MNDNHWDWYSCTRYLEREPFDLRIANRSFLPFQSVATHTVQLRIVKCICHPTDRFTYLHMSFSVCDVIIMCRSPWTFQFTQCSSAHKVLVENMASTPHKCIWFCYAHALIWDSKFRWTHHQFYDIQIAYFSWSLTICNSWTCVFSSEEDIDGVVK